MNTQDNSKVLDANGKPIGRPKTKRERLKALGERLKAFWQPIYMWILTIGAILAVGISMLTCEEKVRNRVSPNGSAESQVTTPIRQVSVDPNTGRTALYGRTRSRVDERAEYLIREKIEQWLFISTGKLTITYHDGRTFAPGDTAFSGAVDDVFGKKHM